MWSAVDRSTSRQPVRRTFSWRTERARVSPVSAANGTSGECALPEVAPSEARSVACAGSIRASAARCGCPSENIPRGSRDRPSRHPLTARRAVRGFVGLGEPHPLPKISDFRRQRPSTRCDRRERLDANGEVRPVSGATREPAARGLSAYDVERRAVTRSSFFSSGAP